MAKRVALYLRVSTDDQTIANQREALMEVAERNGWHVVATYEDNGVSGSRGRGGRPGYDRLCTGVTRREFDMVMAWSVCRLGRSLQHLVTFLGELQAKGVAVVIDTSSAPASPVTINATTTADENLTINAGDAKAVIDVARQRDVFLMEAMWTRYLPA
ncbi:MAG: recombinase family protein, partial [Acidobacteria bacterium]|nr:recombinase family protein [Acidobacteriota bacterium]